MEKPVISVITCTYNSEKYLEKCLHSVETQTLTNIEHIFNDSYSSDNTIKIINKYIKRNKNRYQIKFFQTKPQGIAKALNDAYFKAEGEIVHFLHGDDYYYKSTSLEKVADIFKKNKNCGWITGNPIFEYKNKVYKMKMPKIMKTNLKKFLSISNFLSHENTFVKKVLLEKYGGFNENNKITIEYRLWLRILENIQPVIVNEYFTVFIVHSGSTSTGSLIKFSKALLEGAKTIKDEKIIPVIGIKTDALMKYVNKYR